MNENELMAAGGNLPTATGQMPVAVMKEQVQIIQQVLESVMKKGVHYDEIPGTGKWEKINGKWDYVPGKPVLLKAGVEKINMVCRIGSEPEIDREFDGFDTHFHIRCRMFDIRTGNTLGYGVGEGSTSESKYAWRKAVCDEEFEATLETRRRIHWQKKSSDDKDKKEQPTFEAVKQVRQNPADIINTVLKMAVKRAEVDGCRKVTACSDVFDQDLDESHIRDAVGVDTPPKQPTYQRPEKKEPEAASPAGNAPASNGLISDAQRKRAYAIAKQDRGLSDDEFAFICFDVAGVNSSKDITRDKYDAVIAAIQAAEPGKVM